MKEAAKLIELEEYIQKTYSQHYSGKTQAIDLIISSGIGEEYCCGNLIKYASRFGKKDAKRMEALKIAHYAILLLCALDSDKVSAQPNGDADDYN